MPNTMYGSSDSDALSGRGRRDIIDGAEGDDHIDGGAGADRIRDGEGNDIVTGGDGDDHIILVEGNDAADGGAGDDRIVSLGDAGEPDPAQSSADDRVGDYASHGSNDTLTGGEGADAFIFMPLLNAREEFIYEHTTSGGTTVWQLIAGENDNVHDHWVEGIGTDVITDFNADEGDTLLISGHTVDVTIAYMDTDQDGIDDATYLHLYSNQHGNGGAHNMDDLGTIIVLGALLTEDDFTVNSNPVHSVESLDNWII